MKIGLYLMTQCSVKVASGPLQARNDLFRCISLKISFVPHPSCDCTNYLTCDIKMTNLSYCTIFLAYIVSKQSYWLAKMSGPLRQGRYNLSTIDKNKTLLENSCSQPLKLFYVTIEVLCQNIVQFHQHLGGATTPSNLLLSN